MKSIFTILFLSLGMSMFSANTVKKNVEVQVKEVVIKKETATETKKEVSIDENNAVAFQVYYAFKWLYTDSPFIKKLDALA